MGTIHFLQDLFGHRVHIGGGFIQDQNLRIAQHDSVSDAGTVQDVREAIHSDAIARPERGQHAVIGDDEPRDRRQPRGACRDDAHRSRKSDEYG